ncbi:MAG: alpha/beta hydrolase [Pedobacter sp.]|nr:MAG: alpha/beta hydrolase [Pedobacter sp.]
MYNYVHIKNGETNLNNFTPSERPVIFMLRGLARSYKGWLGTEDDLSHNFDVICVDLPGVGISKQEKHLYNVKSIADKMLEVINHLKLDKFYIVAPSLGSIISYEIVRQLDPKKIKGLVIIVPSHSGLGIKRLSGLGLRTIATSAFVSEEVKIAMFKNMLIGKTVDGVDLFKEDATLERKWKNQLLQDNHELQRKGQLAQTYAAAKYTSKLGVDYIRDNQIPLKLMISTADRMIPIKHKKAIYDYIKHPKSELIEMKNAGHDFIVTHKDQVIDVITKFIADENYKANPDSNNNLEIIKDKKGKGALFFVSTLVAGTLLFLVTKKYKDKL